MPSLRISLEATFHALVADAERRVRGSQTVCNYLGALGLLSVLSTSGRTPRATVLGVGAVLVVPALDGETGPAAAPANGPREDKPPARTVMPLTGAGRAPECESGQRDLRDRAPGDRRRARLQQAATERTAGAGRDEPRRDAARALARRDPGSGCRPARAPGVRLYVFVRPDPLHDAFEVRAVVTSVSGVTPAA